MTNELLQKAFALGFMISREGFNGECEFEWCAPSELEPHSCYRETTEDFIAEMENNEAFVALREKAMKYLSEMEAAE